MTFTNDQAIAKIRELVDSESITDGDPFARSSVLFDIEEVIEHTVTPKVTDFTVEQLEIRNVKTGEIDGDPVALIQGGVTIRLPDGRTVGAMLGGIFEIDEEQTDEIL